LLNHDEIKLFALDASRDYGDRVSRHAGVPLSRHEEREFEDGEHKTRPLESVRGCDVYVIQSLYGDARQSINDKLCRLLFFIGALKDASAARVTAVIPYLCYARKDRKTQPRDPVTTRYVAELFEAVGVDHVLTMDVHNTAAFHNAFRCTTDHLEARALFADYLAPHLRGRHVTVVSPDAGGLKRAERFRRALSERLDSPIAAAFMEKYRGDGTVTGEALIGDVKNSTVVIVDDLISTGTTVARAAQACRRHGAEDVYVVASHGLFVGNAGQVIRDLGLNRIIITDSIPPYRLDPQLAREKIAVVEAAALFADAVRRLHGDGSITSLMEG
jgi:ribose-phosphate pyrophosphokinase